MKAPPMPTKKAEQRGGRPEGDTQASPLKAPTKPQKVSTKHLTGECTCSAWSQNECGCDNVDWRSAREKELEAWFEHSEATIPLTPQPPTKIVFSKPEANESEQPKALVAPEPMQAEAVAKEIWETCTERTAHGYYRDNQKAAALITTFVAQRTAELEKPMKLTAAIMLVKRCAELEAANARLTEALLAAADKFAQVQKHDASRYLFTGMYKRAFEHNGEHPILGCAKAAGQKWLTPGEVAQDGERAARAALTSKAPEEPKKDETR